MSQTQLASMFLGNPYVADRDSRLKGVSSQLDATIHILDGQSNQGIILDYITAKNIIEDTHTKSLEDTLETYTFTTFSDKDFSEHLEKRNRIIIPDEDGSLVEFVMFEVIEDRISHQKQVFAHASYLELKKASVLYPDSFKGTASQHVGRSLDDTGWQVGIIEATGNKTLSIENHTNPYEFIKRIAREFDAELRFRIEHDGNKVTGRYVDLLEEVGEWRGREIELGKDLDGIKRTEKQDVVTALLGIGPEDEDGNRLEVLVEDEEALQRWGREDESGDLHHLIEPYEIQSEREDMTKEEARQYTRTALDKRINTQVEYEATIVDLENVPGMENKKIRFGDTIRIKDTSYKPALYLEARIFEMDRSIKSKAKKDLKLGDFVEFTEDEVKAVWNQLRNEIRKRVSIDQVIEYAEPKKIESDTAPTIKEGSNPIWIDTSKPIKIPHAVVDDEWTKISPTLAEEVGAYSKEETYGKTEIDTVFDEIEGMIELRVTQGEAKSIFRQEAGSFTFSADQINFDGHVFGKDATFDGKISSVTGDYSLELYDATLYGKWEGGSFDYESEYGSHYLQFRQIRNGNPTGGVYLDQGMLAFGKNPSPGYGSDVWGQIMTGPSIDSDGNVHNTLNLFSDVVGIGGELTLLDSDKGLGHQNGINFSGGNTIGEREDNWSFYGNRSNGRPFEIRSHSNHSGYRSDFYVSQGGTLYSPGTFDNKTTNSPTMRVGTSAGHITNTVSSEKYKLNIQTPKDYYKILNISPRTWYDKGDVERYADALSRKHRNKNYSFGDVERIKRIGGLVAEEVEGAGLDVYVDYDESGEVSGVAYDRIWTLLIPIIRDLKEDVEVLKSESKTE